MRRAQKVAVLFAVLVARQAAFHDFCGGNFPEPEDFCRIALAFDVRPSRPVASFAAFAGRLATLVERGLPVRGLLKVLIGLFVALRA